MTWALVPLKSPETAKSRLATVLSPGERRALFFALAQRVIAALQATPGIERVVVVTASEEVAAFARGLEAQVLRQPADTGTAEAFVLGLEQLKPLALDRVLMIAGDLPLLQPAALQALLDAADDGAQIVLAPDRRRLGTNALLCTPPQAIEPVFGEDSFSRHYAAALARGYASCVVELEALSLDLDTPADLDEWQRLQAMSGKRSTMRADAGRHQRELRA